MVRALSVMALWLGIVRLYAALGQTTERQPTYMAEVLTVPVPDYKGRTLAQVQAANVVPGTKGKLFADISSQGPADGVVVQQTPAAGTTVVPGEFRLALTLGPIPQSTLSKVWQQVVAPPLQRTVVPDLTAKTRSEASGALDRAHRKASFSGDATGVVAQQSPAAGTSVMPGSAVSVTLAVPPSWCRRCSARRDRKLRAF